MMATKFNTSMQCIQRNIKYACKLDVEWLQIHHEKSFNGTVAIIGGAPSIKNKVDEIKSLKNDGVMIWSVNGTHDWLIENGITPDFFCMLDGRPANDFAKLEAPDCIYMIASQCHKSVFERLKDRCGMLWHCEFEEMDKQYIADMALKRGVISFPFIAGKGSVGLTSLCVAFALGFRDFVIYGMDSSFDGYQHAYKQELNESNKTAKINVAGQEWVTTSCLFNQVDTYRKLHGLLMDEGCRIINHSEGLMKAMDNLLQENYRELKTGS